MRGSAGLALIGTAALVLSGCGASNDDAAASANAAPTSAAAGTSAVDATPSTPLTSSAAQTAAQVDVQELVLPADQFPAGFTVQPVPASQVEQIAQEILNTTKTATFTPSSCAQLNLLPEKFDVDKVGLAVATKDAQALSASVTSSGATIAEQRASVTGKCANITAEFTEGELAGAKVAVKQSIVAAPAVKATDVLVVDQRSSVDMAGMPANESLARLGLAAVNGYLVTVQYRSADTRPVDAAVFNDVFVKAVNRVADQTG